MTTVKEFLARVNRIEGVDGSLLVRADGHLLGQQVRNPEMLSSLLTISARYARIIMDKAGLSYFRLLSFERGGGGSFHVFPLNQYYLGVVQSSAASQTQMIEKVTQLLSLVKTGSAKDKVEKTTGAGGSGIGL